MDQIQNTYRRLAARGWRERWMNRFGMNTVATHLQNGALTVPNWLTGKSIVFFFVAMILSWFAFGHMPEFALWVVACMSVVLFFFG